MTEIPESLLRRSAEAKAKALGLPVEQVLAEMKGEAPPTPPPSAEPAPEDQSEETVAAEMEESAERSAEIEEAVEAVDDEPAPKEEVPAEPAAESRARGRGRHRGRCASRPTTEAPPVAPKTTEGCLRGRCRPVRTRDRGRTGRRRSGHRGGGPTSPGGRRSGDGDGDGSGNGADGGNGAGNGAGKVAAVVSTRPTVPPKGTPEGVRTQRLLTVVKARAIQTVKAEPTDKVNTWPHLMLMEFGALLAITGLVVIMSVVIHSPLLDPANFNATPNPSKAPWYFLGLQELLSYFDPQIAGVTIPTITGFIGFWLIPYVDKNPSTRPSDRKFAIALYSVFLAGAATLTIFGVLFRGLGFNFSYPWKDGVYFDDLKDWVQFE